MPKPSKNAKALVAVGALAVAVGRALTDGAVSQPEVEQILLAAAAVVGVWAVPNK